MEQKYRTSGTPCSKRMGALRDEAAHGGKQAVLCGDFIHRAHAVLTSRTPRPTRSTPDFCPKNVPTLDKWLDEYEFVDVMRSLAGDIQGPYTWWSQRGRAFDNNVGWRIDYQFATPELAETARGFVIDKAPTYDKRWSDHARTHDHIRGMTYSVGQHPKIDDSLAGRPTPHSMSNYRPSLRMA